MKDFIFSIEYHQNMERCAKFTVFSIKAVDAETKTHYCATYVYCFDRGTIYVPKNQEDFDPERHQSWYCHSSDMAKIERAIKTLENFYFNRFENAKVYELCKISNKIEELKAEYRILLDNGVGELRNNCSYQEFLNRMSDIKEGIAAKIAVK